MAIFKDQNAVRKDASPMSPDASLRKDTDSYSTPLPSQEPALRPRTKETRESVIASGITIDGTIEGAGHVRMAGRFKGDVNVDGDLTIDPGAKITGSVRASTVTIGGELEGNVDGASRVELLAGGILNGDLKAGSLTVASGSRMRGNVSFGWEEAVAPQPRLRVETDTAS
jgi:cytoskeletal protein CcmA (bactofilin family)